MPAAPSTRYVVLLRGVNVGKAGRVAMADLRGFLGEMGFADVATLLNSGNVVLTAADTNAAELAARLGPALSARFGISPNVVVVSADDLAVIIAENPLAPIADNPSRLVVGFVGDTAVLERVEPLLGCDWDRERIALGSRAVYSWHPDGITAGVLSAALGKALGDSATSRNWGTATKLLELAGR
jgi:uncharacterized protein (DUF1697 family)